MFFLLAAPPRCANTRQQKSAHLAMGASTKVIQLLVNGGMFFELARDSKADFSRHPLRFATTLAGTPKSHRFVAVANHAAMAGLVFVNFRIGIGKADSMAKHVHGLRIAG